MTNSTYIICLLIILFFTKARDVYRERDMSDNIWLQCNLILVSIINLLITIVVVSIDWEGNSRDNIMVRLFIYPYLNSFIRPLIFTLSVRSVKSFWKRYLIVIS